MKSFQELDLPPFLRESLHRMNFKIPTPVQAQAIPPGLAGRDVIASAQTGTGKTAGFGIPLLAYLASHPDRMAMVLTPTRELAEQVREVLRMLSGTQPGLDSVLLIGGAGMGGQLAALQRKPRLVIGTPGRIIDHLERRTLDLAPTGFLVLDEADRMLDMGFAPQLERIRAKLPSERQTLLFSATLPANIQAMGSLYLRDPIRVAVGGDARPVETVRQMVIHSSEARKFDDLLVELKERRGSVLLFARTQHRVDRVLKKLKEQKFKATRIHGGRSQSQRRNAIELFRDGSYDILVATDIAARGLDIQSIGHVINYDLPRNAEDYIHRIGRTARAGAQGDSLSFLTPEDGELWGKILRLLGAGKSAIREKQSHFKDHAPAPAAHAPNPHGPKPHGPSHPPQQRYQDRHRKPHHGPGAAPTPPDHGRPAPHGPAPSSGPSQDYAEDDDRGNRMPPPGQGQAHHPGQRPSTPDSRPFRSNPTPYFGGGRYFDNQGRSPSDRPGHRPGTPGAPFGDRRDRYDNRGPSNRNDPRRRGRRGPFSVNGSDPRGDRQPFSGGGNPFRGDRGPNAGGGHHRPGGSRGPRGPGGGRHGSGGPSGGRPGGKRPFGKRY